MKKYVLAITGASGAVLGLAVLAELIKSAEVHLIITSRGFITLKLEAGLRWGGGSRQEVQERVRTHFGSDSVSFWPEDDMTSPAASGSFLNNGMLVVPCTMKTLSGIASGYSGTLVERAADVTIKEGRPLVLCPREMPLSAIHLENMLKLARLGVKIVPPMMGFYHGPHEVQDLLDFAAGKLLDTIGVQHSLFKRWEGLTSQ